MLLGRIEMSCCDKCSEDHRIFALYLDESEKAALKDKDSAAKSFNSSLAAFFAAKASTLCVVRGVFNIAYRGCSCDS